MDGRCPVNTFDDQPLGESPDMPARSGAHVLEADDRAARLAVAVQKVRDLHRRRKFVTDNVGRYGCDYCCTDWPCETVRILDEALS